ncbi:MAG: protein kinase [Acidimicrobiales bacterium]
MSTTGEGGEAHKPTPAPAVDLGLEGYDGYEEIGRGGFSVVYRARQLAFDRTVAIKVISGVVDEQTLLRFERECRTMGSLSGHPSIVTVFGSGVLANGNPYLVMEYLERGSLADRLERGPLPWDEAADVAVKIGGALQAAHDAGVLHRDVKPENIFVSSYGEPKLGDFGIARLEGGPNTRSGVITASVAHAAPEILDGKRPDEATDVYSLGSTVYTLLAGAPAFSSATDESIVPMLARIAIEPVPDLRGRGVPAPICEVLEASMAKDPALRIRTARELAERMEAARHAAAGAPAAPLGSPGNLTTVVTPATGDPVPGTTSGPVPPASVPGVDAGSVPPPGAVAVPAASAPAPGVDSGPVPPPGYVAVPPTPPPGYVAVPAASAPGAVAVPAASAPAPGVDSGPVPPPGYVAVQPPPGYVAVPPAPGTTSGPVPPAGPGGRGSSGSGKVVLIVVAVVALLAVLGGGAAVVVGRGGSTTTVSSTSSSGVAPTVSTPPSTGGVPPSSANGVRSLDLTVGDCFDHPDLQGVIDGAVTEAELVTQVSCDQAHQLEVIAVQRLTASSGSPYPGTDAVANQARSVCDRAFQSYVGVPLDQSTLSVIFEYPSADEWAGGERRVVCSAYAQDLSSSPGSVKDSGR